MIEHDWEKIGSVVSIREIRDLKYSANLMGSTFSA